MGGIRASEASRHVCRPWFRGGQGMAWRPRIAGSRDARRPTTANRLIRIATNGDASAHCLAVVLQLPSLSEQFAAVQSITKESPWLYGKFAQVARLIRVMSTSIALGGTTCAPGSAKHFELQEAAKS